MSNHPIAKEVYGRDLCTNFVSVEIVYRVLIFVVPYKDSFLTHIPISATCSLFTDKHYLIFIISNGVIQSLIVVCIIIRQSLLQAEGNAGQ